MDVNHHKMQDMWVRKCIYLYYFIVNQYQKKKIKRIFFKKKALKRNNIL